VRGSPFDFSQSQMAKTRWLAVLAPMRSWQWGCFSFSHRAALDKIKRTNQGKFNMGGIDLQRLAEEYWHIGLVAIILVIITIDFVVRFVGQSIRLSRELNPILLTT
jgi:hypothetical protein